MANYLSLGGPSTLKNASSKSKKSYLNEILGESSPTHDLLPQASFIVAHTLLTLASKVKICKKMIFLCVLKIKK
jgi:hypothetical protein